MTCIFSIICVLSAGMNFMAEGNLITGGWDYMEASLLTCLAIDAACQLKLQLRFSIGALACGLLIWCLGSQNFLRGGLWRTIILRGRSENQIAVYELGSHEITILLVKATANQLIFKETNHRPQLLMQELSKNLEAMF